MDKKVAGDTEERKVLGNSQASISMSDDVMSHKVFKSKCLSAIFTALATLLPRILFLIRCEHSTWVSIIRGYGTSSFTRRG
jgi:hypothetical protein